MQCGIEEFSRGLFVLQETLDGKIMVSVVVHSTHSYTWRIVYLS
jgi:hypothetical protein